MTNTYKNIIPHLWFDKEANEAAEFYTSIFPESKIKRKHLLMIHRPAT